ncbi:A/G-specific adenine glycosylase [Sphingomicrobium astaxanthinifaciens]|uniref:A/G-specific adenine glycosylase n=1 Tax=Sphingomicrobium astaxanthinifaciens TaxID=1227949 RepID=UPI001FCC4508|nr:A/G-specific adenine glycosylase [Sphingomicrobium astaxanthinifaciens]MCJ7421513.1 A/G-specific adenine glycosylase [Sphingomicrobium astaxanthinifaciens]
MRKSPRQQLLEHYRAHARDLPWRTPPGAKAAPDPYHVWLSEVMLQQTTVATVAPRFDAFLARWPTVEAMAAAPLEEVLGQWAGLGYYARARNLHACAVAVAGRGGFPDSEAGLRALPGIGDYTAAAVAAIAFGREAVVVDTNVERVVARYFAIRRPVKDARAEIRERAAFFYEGVDAGAMAQALMDLGATICRPRTPDCAACPLADTCAAHAGGDPASIPPRPPRKARPERHGTAFVIERDGAIFLVRRPEKGVLGGMAALPGSAWRDGAPPAPAAAAAAIRHVFTHFALTLAVESRPEPPRDVEGWWQPRDRLAQAGLPTLYVKALAAFDAARGAPSLLP